MSKVRKAYKSYVRFCKINGFPPAPFDLFVQKLDVITADVISARMDEQTDVDAPFIAVSVASAPIPNVDSARSTCAQCQEPVWISEGYTERAKKSKNIICDRCAPEVFGKPMQSLIAEQIARLT